ncbi:endonuclease/exonuclease/phosphatase family protein [Streptomyces sp. CAU 1734]|uniref:endonuclease/exonuclease/phosphatase family protein n=1 Tax=Streptomyces sp. CAU 1734 TaxID=3140360 RepID=UPI003260D4C7
MSPARSLLARFLLGRARPAPVPMARLADAEERRFTDLRSTAMPVTAQPLRAVTWNLRCGGIDDGSERRLRAQGRILAGLRPDLLALQECTHWDEQEERRLLWMCRNLGMEAVHMARSRVGDGRNHTTLLYRPSALRLVGRRTLGDQVFHHALIRARLRPVAAGEADHSDFLALATHLAHTDGETRLREARWLTDYAGAFPGTPGRALLLGDLNCSGVYDTDPPDWSLVPHNLHSRYRRVTADGRFGAMDRRAVRVLLASGWTDPQTFTRHPRTPTVGYAYANEPVPLRLDHILVRDLPVTAYRTHDTPEARAASDHLPVVLDTHLTAGSCEGSPTS